MAMVVGVCVGAGGTGTAVGAVIGEGIAVGG